MSLISGLFSGSLLASAEAQAKQAGKTSQLEQALKQAANGGGDTAQQLSSYMLDLSEQAKAYLAGQTAQATTADPETENFSLSQAELKQLRDIIARYKDAPLTQATYDQIAQELKSAGLGADQLAAKEQVNAFNPLQLFLDAFNGTNTALTSEQIGSAAQVKKDNYVSGIIEYWASINTSEPEPEA